MFVQTLVLSVIGTANIAFLLMLAIKLFSHYKQDPLGLRKFFFLLVAEIVFSFAFLGAYLATEPYLFNLFLQGMFASQMCLSTLCLFFFLDMADIKTSAVHNLKKALTILLIVHIILSLTNSFHHLIYISAVKETQTMTYLFEQGPWLVFMRNYSLLILLCNCYVILIAMLGKNKKAFSITLCIFFAFAITSTISIFYDRGLFPLPFNPVGLFLSIPSFLVYYSCFEYLDKARSKAIDFMEDAYFVFDLKGGLIDRNASAYKFISRYYPDSEFNIKAICQLIGVDNPVDFHNQEFSIMNGTARNYFRGSYFYVSDSISQICGHGFLIREITDIKEQVNSLNTAANIDPLTGARNRRYFDIYCKKLYTKYITFNSSITLLMLDLDHFKKVNDTYGHGVGDEVLKAFALICLDNLRNEDMLFRFGGEEFVVIIDGANADSGKHAADRIRDMVAHKPIQTTKGPISITVSIGGCSSPSNHDLDIALLVEVADKLLYKAKNGGRNRVEFLDLKKY